ncbi:MAG: DUF4130 domain-containing protein [Thermoplasmata archaeon]|nr:DUF4130 domain-containing protein [Thermoplasmata archaeon]
MTPGKCGVDREWLLAMLPRHARADRLLVLRVERMDPRDLCHLSAPLARKAYNMARAVAGDAHRSMAFLRLGIYRDTLLWGYIKPVHRVEDMVVRSLRKRYPKHATAVCSPRGVFHAVPGGDVHRENLVVQPPSKGRPGAERPSGPLAVLFDRICETAELLGENEETAVRDDSGEEGIWGEIWSEYYQTQYIEDRRNPRLFHRAMPKRYLSSFPGLEAENVPPGNSTLDDFG